MRGSVVVRGLLGVVVHALPGRAAGRERAGPAGDGRAGCGSSGVSVDVDRSAAQSYLTRFAVPYDSLIDSAPDHRRRLRGGRAADDLCHRPAGPGRPPSWSARSTPDDLRARIDSGAAPRTDGAACRSAAGTRRVRHCPQIGPHHTDPVRPPIDDPRLTALTAPRHGACAASATPRQRRVEVVRALAPLDVAASVATIHSDVAVIVGHQRAPEPAAAPAAGARHAAGGHAHPARRRRGVPGPGPAARARTTGRPGAAETLRSLDRGVRALRSSSPRWARRATSSLCR